MNDTYVATVAGAFVNVLAVLLTLWVTHRNFKINQKEECEKARIKRAFQAKHKPLVTTAEAVTYSLNYYMALADRSIHSDGSTTLVVSQIAISFNLRHFYCGINT